MGKVIQLPLSPDLEYEPVPSCEKCVFYCMGAMGEYCRAFQEDIFSVKVAADCGNYTEI